MTEAVIGAEDYVFLKGEPGLFTGETLLRGKAPTEATA